MYRRHHCMNVRRCVVFILQNYANFIFESHKAPHLTIINAFNLGSVGAGM